MVKELNDYQDQAIETKEYPYKEHNIVYPALKLNGEAGEVAEYIGKLWRKGLYNIGQVDKLPLNHRLQIALELGDVLWYIAILGSEINFSLQEIADLNLAKVKSRKEDGTVTALKH